MSANVEVVKDATEGGRDDLLFRFRVLAGELGALDADLQGAGERELGDVVKRARRELELAERQGLFLARGVY